MKKSLLAVALGALILPATSHADTFLGVYAGASAWNMDTEGGFANSTSLTNFDFESETKSSFYVALEHPIPLIPNLKVARTGMDTMGDTTVSTSFSFGGELFASNSTVMTDIELSTTDFIMYYELFDNDLVSFDIGINGKYVDGNLFVQDTTDATINAREEFSGVVPMVYSKLAIGLPFSGLGVFVEGSFLSVDDHTLSDYQAAITYELVDNAAVDVDIQLGYREMTLELDDLDDIYSDLKFSGVYAGLEIHF